VLQLVGEFATRVQRDLCERLAAASPAYDWETEVHVGNTPVDVVGRDSRTVVLVELEWRRADPADNAAKLFRHLSAGTLDADRIVVCQLFTEYYDLATGGVSAKRKNAEFVGRVAAEALGGLTYRAVDLPLNPPKRGGDLPADWQQPVATAVEEIVSIS